MREERWIAYVEKIGKVTEEIQEKLQDRKRKGLLAKKISGTDFEEVVYDCLLEAGFEKENITHSTQKFPDFIVEDIQSGKKIGIEVKKTDSKKWEVIGGSIYESLKNDIDDTYIIMAKMGGDNPEVRFRKYEECIADLKVTHSPRFYLDMDLEKGRDYLSQNDAMDLLELSGEELNKKIRKLLRTKKSTWWSEGETIAFSELSREEKNIYLNEGIALFPEVFKGDYHNFTPWLVYSCYVWCGNVRDIFSAGGNKYVDELGIYVSAIMYRALENIENIRQRIFDMSEEEMEKFWGQKIKEDKEKIIFWLGLVKKNLKLSAELLTNNKQLCLDTKNQDEVISSKIKDKYLKELEMRIMIE